MGPKKCKGNNDDNRKYQTKWEDDFPWLRKASVGSGKAFFSKMEATSSGTNQNKGTTNMSVNPVNFLYKTMRERDPRKRRVKPVSDELVQVNFELGDSDEDSDFDIGKIAGGSKKADKDFDDEEDDGSDDGSSDDLDDEDEEDEDDVVSENEDGDLQEEPMEVTTEHDPEDSNMSSDDEEDDESIDTEDDDDGDLSDDEEEDDEEDDNEADGLEEANEGMESPEIKGLGQMWSMIDSDEDDEDYVPKKKKKKPQKGNKKSDAASKASKTTASSSTVVKRDPELTPEMALTPPGRIKVLVCCVCLSDRSADDDEIVECDNCGVSVHEGCYGISESHSTASTESSASTEPWFCDACKANAKPVCELCPNTGGIYKETDNGKWVHIVCALYTPGVAFGDVDKLTLVTLFEMPYSKWGARECSLCEDSRFSQTGVCINCDAGMCKAYFHVTCAQREGLLAEATPEDALEVADPFFAYCKLHADKFMSKIKRRNWLAIQSHVKNHTLDGMQDGQEKIRFDRKLRRHREKYSIAKLKRPPTWLPTQKMVRHLHTSPSAVRGFLRKAELMGVITQTVPVEKQEVRKKVQGQPQFSAEFINYFVERNLKVDTLKNTVVELNSQNDKLQAQERKVRKQYEKLQAEVDSLREVETKLSQEGESLCGMLSDIYGKPVPTPEVFRSKKRNSRVAGKKEAVPPVPTLIHQCGVCRKTTEQHLLAKCDSCLKHYHLGCLDPPLTRMPKKTKLFGWQCSYCVSSSSSDSMAPRHQDVDQPRRLRENIKEPDKFFHLTHVQDSLKSHQKKSLLNKKSRQRRKHREIQAAKNKGKGHSPKRLAKPSGKSGISPTGQSKKAKMSPSSQPGSSLVMKLPDGCGGTVSVFQNVNDDEAGASSSADRKSTNISSLPIMCVVCNKDGTITDTVRCDECLLSYHLGCLDPPMKKSPKVRGYAWHCEACDRLSDSESADGRRTVREKQRAQVDSPDKRPTGREASNSILFDIDVSSDDEDYSL